MSLFKISAIALLIFVLNLLKAFTFALLVFVPTFLFFEWMILWLNCGSFVKFVIDSVILFGSAFVFVSIPSFQKIRPWTVLLFGVVNGVVFSYLALWLMAVVFDNAL